MKLLCLLLMMSCSVPVLAQDQHYFFRGTITSEAKKEPVSYASISVRGRNAGVVANERGEFAFSIRPQYFDDTIEIAAIGYKPFTSVIRQLMNMQVHQIRLQDTVAVLDEVVVRNKTATQFLMEAMDLVKDNFPSSPYEMDCFYRNTIKENGTYVRLYESQYKAFDKNFNAKNASGSVVLGDAYTRVSNDYRNKATRMPYPFFRPHWLLTMENYGRDLRTITGNINKDQYEIDYERDQILNGERVRIISAKVKESVTKFLFDIVFFIRDRDKAFMQMNFSGKSKIGYLRPSGIPNYVKLKPIDWRNIYIFTEHDNKMYMHYLNNFASYEWQDPRNGQLINACEENAECIIQNFTPSPNGKPSFEKSGRKKFSGLIPSNYDAEKEMWKNPFVQQIAFDPKIKTDLEKEASLEAQYSQNSNKD